MGRPQSTIPTCFSVPPPCQRPIGTTTIDDPNLFLRPNTLPTAHRDNHNQRSPLVSPSQHPASSRKGHPQSTIPTCFSVPFPLLAAERDDHNQRSQLVSPSPPLVNDRKGRPQSKIPTCFSVPTPCQQPKRTTTILLPNNLLCPLPLPTPPRSSFPA